MTSNRLLGKIGIISYGVYLLHLPVLIGLHRAAPRFGLPLPGYEFYVNVGALLLTLALASVSWIFFERRIVNWGRSFKYQHTRATEAGSHEAYSLEKRHQEDIAS